MTSHTLLNISARMLFSWLLLSLLGIFFGRQLLVLTLPYLNWLTDIISPLYSPELELINKDNTYLLHMKAIVNQAIPIHHSMTIQRGSQITSSGHLIHTLVPLVILFSVLSAWPAESFHVRIKLIISGMLMMFLVLGLTVPFLLAGKIEVMFIQYAAQGGVQRDKPWVLSWMIFTETGGRWLIPVVAAFVSIIFVQNINKAKQNLQKQP